MYLQRIIVAAILALFCVAAINSAPAEQAAKTGASTEQKTVKEDAKKAPDKIPEKEKMEATPSGTLRLVPDVIRFTSTDAGTEVRVFFGETPAKASQVTSAKIVEKAWMFNVSKSSKDLAVVTVRTNPKTAEDGSYRLTVSAGGQTAYADVFITLGSPEDAAASFTLSPRLELDPSYKKGTTLEYEIIAPADAEYTWTVNGKDVLQGIGERKLTYTFSEVGQYTIRMTVKVGARTLGQSEGKTSVTQ